MAGLLAVRVGVLYTGRAEAPLRDVYVAWSGSEIVHVGRERPSGCEVVGEAPVATPAFIDAHCHIGLARAGEPFTEDDTNERFDSVVSLADAVHGLYMDDPMFRDSIEWGVLYSCILPGSGNIIGGRAAVIRNYGRDAEEAFIRHAGLKAALGYNPKSTRDWKGLRPYTRMGVVAILRKWLMKARDAMRSIEEGRKRPEDFEPELRALFPVLRGEEPLRVHVHKLDDIVALSMLRREFGFRATVEHAADVHSVHGFEYIRREGFPLVYGPIDAFPYKTELRHQSWRNVGFLVKARPFYGLMTDHPVVLQRNLYLQLRYFLLHGVSREECISIITWRNARIIGVDDILGTVEPGKWASLVLWSGDPFSLESRPVMVIGEGRILYQAE